MENKEAAMKWEQEAVEELVEDETRLIVRKSTHRKDNEAAEISALDNIAQVSNGVSESNGHAGEAANGVQNGDFCHGEELKVEEPGRVHNIEQSGGVFEVGSNGAIEEDSTHEPGREEELDLEGVPSTGPEGINGDPKPENVLIFYDRDEGIWKCRICSWTYRNESICVDHIQNHKGQMHKLMNVKTLNFESEGVESTHTHIAKQTLKDPEDDTAFKITSLDSLIQNQDTPAITSTFEAHIENDNFLSSNTQPSQNLFQDHGGSHQSSTEIQSVEVDLINEDDLEVEEFDVERVLQKQATHDLYCPNCNSCITKRVILRKRKRRNRISDEDVQRNKKEFVLTSKLDAHTVQLPRDQIQHNDEVGENVDQLIRVDEDDRSQGPAIFRCLSCFSFFIPIGNGLSKLFGEKKGKEDVVDEQISNMKERGSSSKFASTKQKTVAEQGSSSQTDAGVVASSNLNGQIGQPSVVAKSDGLSLDFEGNEEITENNDTLKSRPEILSIPQQIPLSNGKVTIAIRDKSDTETNGRVDAAMENFDLHTKDQLNEPKYASPESNQSVTSVPIINQFTNEESVEDAVSYPEDCGLKLLISSNNGCLASEDSEKSQIANQSMQLGVNGASTDKEAIHVSAASLSVLNVADVNGQMNASLSVVFEKNAKDAAPIESVLENKNPNFRNNEKSGEVYPSEVPQLIFTKTKLEVPSNRSPNVDNVSYSPAGQGKDAVIMIDAAQPTESSEIVPDVIHPTETTLSQATTQTSIAGRDGRKETEIEVIKSIVYGGLAESITSLSVVSSAAGGGAATLNVLALGMANLIGGLFVICHNIWELRGERKEQFTNRISGVADEGVRYKELLGRRENFILHATVAIISYLVFGLVPPAVYGFTFRKTDDKQLKLVVVAAASIMCIAVLAIGRAYVRRPPKPYLKTVLRFVILGFMVSGVGYAAGDLVARLLEKLGLFQSDTGMALGLLSSAEIVPPAWASY
ncbi:uncharacterized protein LOC127256160 isoform X2 [Andrographis paniculata]|uniref:uncharacterized protein LOC127256160 isoform X2 n=1 Tax=Andrographis paniculata TaxID=175694 RepID=UPI0021E8846E|nr:uncharacterized protein LOC127256160 isoform X2 [Andrographis paniculata]